MGQINDRAAPRWQVSSIACAVLSGGRWHDVTVVDISLVGLKLRGRWDYTQPVGAVSLADAGSSSNADLLLMQAELVWLDEAHDLSGLRFDTPDRIGASNFLRFLSGYVADLPAR